MSAATSSTNAELNGSLNGEMNGEIKRESNRGMEESVPASTALPTARNSTTPENKPEKLKPHICPECERGFARLEHLKRHERSHTKEKPFECQECKRCFARRDLLQRHQQKLHSAVAPAAKPRNRRTSSMSGAAGAIGPNPNGVRKHSIANSESGPRPRSNTISNPDGVFRQLGQMSQMNQMGAESNTSKLLNHLTQPSYGHSRHQSLAGLPMQNAEFGGMRGAPMNGMFTAMEHRNMHHGLPKIETNHNHVGLSNGMRTAPVVGSYPIMHDFNFSTFTFPNGNSPSPTIDPSALVFKHSPQFNHSPQSMAIDPVDTFNSPYQDYSGTPMLDDYGWEGVMPHFTQGMTFDENAIDGSSPSAISTASQSGISDGVMLDGSNNTVVSSASVWNQPLTASLVAPNFLDHNKSTFANLYPMSPHSLPQNHLPLFPTPPPLNPYDHPAMPGMNNMQGFQPPMTFGPETPNSTTGSIHGSLPLSTVTDATRSALANALAHNASFGGRKFSFPSANSPSTPFSRPAIRANSVSEGVNYLPSTRDLRRYIGAYIEYFHPHLPFLHVPTLNFDYSAYTNDGQGAATSVEGPGCLALSMAAIGALYSGDRLQSKSLFELAKKMLQLYLEIRRKAGVRRADHRSKSSESSTHTPLFLAQAMLLNIIYGFNSGDQVAGDNALIHCATLVSLYHAVAKPSGSDSQQQDVQMTDDDDLMNGSSKTETSNDQQEWYKWKTAEETKRTYYAIFILSSMLVSAINHPPFLTNSEIELNLPCDEEFWSADTAEYFHTLGGPKQANQNQTTFSAALRELLEAGKNQQHQQAQAQHFSNGHNAQNLPRSDLRPSTFGCLVLINALHNYIMETRQRHADKTWTNDESDQMYKHIEPALKAWQEAWQLNPRHSVHRPNPFGPLSADSVPLLDLAYVRLFVNMSKSKEMFWKRNFDDMANELAGGKEMMQHTEHSPNSNADSMEFSGGSSSSSVFVDSPASSNSPPDLQSSRAFQHPASQKPKATNRERHFRKAAYYAADSLVMSDQLGLTFADFTSRDLPLQSAMCAFDCAQVVAEWVSLLQERVGCYLGILGHPDVDLSGVPVIMYLEDEEVKLLVKIRDIVDSGERKMHNEQTEAAQMNAGQRSPALDHCGYGSRILRLIAYQLDRAAVWQVTHLMARALETQAIHMQTRAERSDKPKNNLL